MPPTVKQNAYDFSAELLDGRTVSLGQFRGRVLLIVNTASHCGFTPQYAGLEQLYRTYKEQGFEVLAFPCNQFGAQEPGAAAEIAAFCEKNYEVSFPVFSRIEVNGKNAHPLFAFLRKEKPGLLGLVGAGGIKWNFTKFLVDRRGHVVERFSPATPPEVLAGQIEHLLGGPV
jgi:glutathione peroxidase